MRRFRREKSKATRRAAAHRKRVEQAAPRYWRGLSSAARSTSSPDVLCRRAAADAHATMPPPEARRKQSSSQISMPDVILRIDGLFGGSRQQRAGGKRIAPVGQQMNSRQAGMGRDGLCHGSAKAGGSARQSVAFLTSFERRERIEQAYGDAQDRQCDDSAGQAGEPLHACHCHSPVTAIALSRHGNHAGTRGT